MSSKMELQIRKSSRQSSVGSTMNFMNGSPNIRYEPAEDPYQSRVPSVPRNKITRENSREEAHFNGPNGPASSIRNGPQRSLIPISFLEIQPTTTDLRNPGSGLVCGDNPTITLPGRNSQ